MESGLPLSERTAIVTGASRGVGKGIALELARAGCRVAVNFSTGEDAARDTVEAARKIGVDAVAVRGDVRRATDVDAMFQEVTRRWGRVHLVVNNAGIQTWGPLVDVTEPEWDVVLDTNLKGCFLCTQIAARHMTAHGGGAIVNIGSGANREPFPKLAAYTASKGGIEMLTRVSAVELGPAGIRVNCVAPGAIEIERTKEENPDYASVWGRVTPLGRVGTPADVGRAVVFLASDNASFITGQTIWVDGGLFTQPVWVY